LCFSPALAEVLDEMAVDFGGNRSPNVVTVNHKLFGHWNASNRMVTNVNIEQLRCLFQPAYGGGGWGINLAHIEHSSAFSPRDLIPTRPLLRHPYLSIYRRLLKHGPARIVASKQELGPAAEEDILKTSSEYIDLAMIAVEIAGLLDKDVLSTKLETYRNFGVKPFPGGHFPF
jgi:hypothetical protein